MYLTAYLCDTDVTNLAAKALCAWRDFRDAARDARADLPLAIRLMQDRHLEAALETPFAGPVLAVGDELLASLYEAVEQAGGTPVLFETQDGESHIVRGTEDGGRIQAAADRLAAFLTLAWRVNDQLIAEAIVAGHRATLDGLPRTGTATPPEHDAQ